MTIRTILVPTDLGPLSGSALDRAAALARVFGARIIVLHVLKASTPRMVLPPGVPVAVRCEIPPSQEHRVQLRALASQYRRAEVPVRDRIEISAAPVASSILHVAREERADLIIMSTHGRDGVKRVVLGSVAEKVVRHATIPVLLVPAGAAEADGPNPRQELGV